MSNITCTLCNSKLELFCIANQSKYYKCTHCYSVLLDSKIYLSREKEQERYEEHNNDIEDPRYQKFVDPIVSEIKRNFNKHHIGLDFGAGTGPVITKLLQEVNFQVQVYDPFFSNDSKLLEEKYDYIICCEVIEHFHRPREEFQLLKSLLKPTGQIYCMTEFYAEAIDFERWYYKNDPTHVFFYHQKAFAWIKSHIGFSEVEIKGRLIRIKL